MTRSSSHRARDGAEQRAIARRQRKDWYSARFDSFEEMAEADLEEAAVMAPAARLRLVFLLSGQLAGGEVTPREAWPVGVLRFGVEPE